MNENVDYKLMYHKMVNAAEEAIRILIHAQQECEDMYLDAEELAAREAELSRKFQELIENGGETLVDFSDLDDFEEMPG